MKRLITKLAGAALLVGAPLATALADDDDRRYGWYGGHGRHYGYAHPGYGYHPGYGPPGRGWKHGHWKGPRRIEHHHYYPPPVVHAPVVVAPPVFYPRPIYGPPPRPIGSVDIGFRVFF